MTNDPVDSSLSGDESPDYVMSVMLLYWRGFMAHMQGCIEVLLSQHPDRIDKAVENLQHSIVKMRVMHDEAKDYLDKRKKNESNG
jgi:hypothetical protein